MFGIETTCISFHTVVSVEPGKSPDSEDQLYIYCIGRFRDLVCVKHISLMIFHKHVQIQMSFHPSCLVSVGKLSKTDSTYMLECALVTE